MVVCSLLLGRIGWRGRNSTTKVVVHRRVILDVAERSCGDGRFDEQEEQIPLDKDDIEA